MLYTPHRLALPDDRELADELAHIRLRTNSAGAVRMDHDSGWPDDRAIAFGIAAWWLLNRLVGRLEFPVFDDDPAGTAPCAPSCSLARYALVPCDPWESVAAIEEPW